MWTLEGIRQDAQLLESKLQTHCLASFFWCKNYEYCTFSLIKAIFTTVPVVFVFEALGHARFCKVKSVLQMNNIHSPQ